MRTFEKNVTGMLVHSTDLCIAMGRKHPDPQCNGPYPNLWVLPGGVVENDESALEAGFRETLDEIGLDLSGYEAKLVNDGDKDETEVRLMSGEYVLYQMRFMVYQVNTGKLTTELPLTIGDEWAEAQWAPIDRLSEYDLCPPSVELFRKLAYLPLASSLN